VPETKNFYLNADDFGLNSSVNNAIIELFDKKIINSTTIMANMPGFDEAIKLARQHNITAKVGAHLVLTEGKPITKQPWNYDYFFNGKESIKKMFKRRIVLKKTTKHLIFNEFEEQILRIRSHGIAISHLDSHHHIHEFYSILQILIELSRKYKIPYIRILNNLNQNSKPYKLWYRNLVNLYLKNINASHSDLFGSQSELIKYLKKGVVNNNKRIEIMVHPDYDSQGKLIDKEGSNQLDFHFIHLLKSKY
jgi:predicted glycoside hydrolase/deacetylase ChbG (UPF0249 family)